VQRAAQKACAVSTVTPPGRPASGDARPYAPEKGIPVRRVTAGAIKRRKSKTLFPVVTAYDAPFSEFAERAGIDVILVGDSLGNVVLGYEETTPVTLDDMIHHAAAVCRGTSRAHVMVDMPFGSYQVSDEDAIRSAIRLVKEGGACSVKMEGGTEVSHRIRAIYGAGIPVVGHIGVMPQTASMGPGYKVRSNRERLLADAKAIEEAGAYAIVLEVIDHEVAREITQTLSIPTIGIGAGPHCDAQVLVLYDVLGMYPNPPSFVKQYADLGNVATEALRNYAADVRERRFPAH
jgi:3-methyl-2-oxobutanoate hydroxymethyltransferase